MGWSRVLFDHRKHALKHTAKVDPTVPSVESLHVSLNFGVANYKYLFEKKPFDLNTPLEPFYIIRSLLVSAIALPFYELALVISASPYVLVSMLTNSFLIALTSLVIFCFAVDVYRSAKIGFALALMFNVCSFVLPYDTTLWAQPLQALTLVAALFFIYKSLHHHPLPICSYLGNLKKAAGVKGTARYGGDKNNGTNSHSGHLHLLNRQFQNRGFYLAGIGGLILGLSVFAHLTSLVFLPGFLVYSFLEMRKKNMGNFLFLVAVLLIVLFLVGVTNYVRFNSFTEFGYGPIISSLAAHNAWSGLVGLLVSPGAGLFLYFPLSILLPWAAKGMWDQNRKRLLCLCFHHSHKLDKHWHTVVLGAALLVGGGLGSQIFCRPAALHNTDGGESACGISRNTFLKYSVIALSVAGFCITMLGVLVWTYYDQIYLYMHQRILFDQVWNTLAWDPVHSPIIVHAKILYENYIPSIPVHLFSHVVSLGYLWTCPMPR
jgi:hypothetical protein